MPPPLQQARIDLGDLKAQLAKRLGPERSQRYFSYLNRLLSQKLSKQEFGKLCLLTLGQENIPLHNQLIRSILKNASQTNAPNPVGDSERSSIQRDDSVAPPVLPNGDVLPLSGSRAKDLPSPLGPNGRVYFAAHRPLGSSVIESRDSNACNLKRREGGSAEQLQKRLRTDHVEDGEDVGNRDAMRFNGGPLRAPLGIPFCSASVGGARRAITSARSSGFASNHDSGELSHSEALRKRMEVIAEAHGLTGVSMDSANLLNTGLDAYLKQMIRSCTQLVGGRSGHEPTKQPVKKQQPHGKQINGVWLGNHTHVQSSSEPLEGVPEPRNHYTVTFQDFKTAMELYPQQLGDDWPLLLEKICISSYEE